MAHQTVIISPAMRRHLYLILLAALSVALPCSYRLQAEHAPTRGFRLPEARQAAAVTQPRSARVWQGRNAEFEQFIREAEIDHFEVVPIGVTHPRRAYFKPGGLVESVAWKVLPPGLPNGYWESYKSEIAAYELDKLLGMDMVPIAVEKQWKREKAAAILWLSPIHSWKEMQDKPKPPKWVPQAARMKMFDDLICNRDRNAGNLLVDDDWNLFLIDHSRAFIVDKGLPVALEHVDRALWTKMLALDEGALDGALGPWIDRGAIRAMIARRDKMKAAIDTLVRKQGEGAVFVQ
jgi:hypothetical protein